jgi:ADP-heptose:LPS heptosyltransferase/GT2 family glycosyltransferase
MLHCKFDVGGPPDTFDTNAGSRNTVPILFGSYELLAKSELFDAGFYTRSNPDVGRLGVDPLIHYLEHGSRERRNPSRHFDTAYYLSQCSRIGETPDNALLHYLTTGAGLGLLPSKLGKAQQPRLRLRRAVRQPDAPGVADCFPVANAGSARAVLNVDIPRIVDGAAQCPVHGGLSIVGWALAAETIASVDVAVDGSRVASARYGLRRPDVAAAHPGREGALMSGYAVHLPPRTLRPGRHRVEISVHDSRGQAASAEFCVEVTASTDEPGPWCVRRTMAQGEVVMKLGALECRQWRPSFHIIMKLACGGEALWKARRTVESLRQQTYTNWQLTLAPAGGHENVKVGERNLRDGLASELAEAYTDLVPRISVVSVKPQQRAPSKRSERARSGVLVVCLAAGDELGCDALLEFALVSLDPNVDFIYADDRRAWPGAAPEQAFFKPAWSPDLLLSTNYIGRVWCATSRLAARARLSLPDIACHGDYDIVLRLTEKAAAVRHIPKVLLQHDVSTGESEPAEKSAIVRALRRRHITAQVRSGILPAHYDVRRRVRAGRVSIIIPTCGARGLVKVCIESLRARTVHRDYEIICVENVCSERAQWRRWFRGNADVVIDARESFNWSRYNNRAVARATGRYLLFLNDDVEIIDPHWLDALLQQVQRPEVGVVGPLLLYPDRNIQHAGVVLGRAGRGLHAFRHLPQDDPGYFGLALTQRNVIGVTGACLLTRRSTFERLGGFEEAHPIINNDLDYCLRAWESGLLNVYTPHARLIHHELASRGAIAEDYDAGLFNRRWARAFALGDPYFNPNLSRDREVFEIEREPVEMVFAGHPLCNRESIRRILIVKLDHIGDCITALPAVRRLKQHFPEARLAVLAARATGPIWRADPTVDEVIEFNLFHRRSGAGKLDVDERDVEALRAQLHARCFDLAIDLRKQPDARYVLQFSGAPLLAGFDTQGRFPWLDFALEWDEDVPLRSKHGHVTDDLIALVDSIAARGATGRGPHLSFPEKRLPLADSERRRLLSKPLVCVHPAAGSVMRQWPPQSFAQLIRLIAAGGRYNIALIGVADEKETADQVLEAAGNGCQVFNLVGRLSLAQLPGLLARSALFVGNNSGPQHLAAGMGIPTVGLHSGVVDAREWAPLGPQALAIRRQMACSPCFIEFPQDCHRGMACMEQLTPGEVFKACTAALLLEPAACGRGV